jgi:prolyl oligopeptidase
MRNICRYGIALAGTVFLAIACHSPTSAQEPGSTVAPPLNYPETIRENIIDKHFGTPVPDPYRWLEGDPGNDERVAGWIASQRALTEDYLSSLEQRHFFQKRLVELYNFDQVTTPRHAGKRLFYTLNDGTSNYPRLVVREGSGGQDRVIIDPNAWSDVGTKALAEWAPSPDGALLAYAVQDRGSDLRTIEVMELATGSVLSDELTARYTQIAWAPDSSGLFYSRVAEATDGASAQAGITGHAVYFHTIGTDQSSDRLVYDTPDQPAQFNSASTSADGRFLYVYSSNDLAKWSISVADLANSDWELKPLIEAGDDVWSVVANRGTKQFVFTTQDAPFGKLMTFELDAPELGFQDLIPEGESILQHAYVVGERLLVAYLVDAKTEVRVFGLDGSAQGEVSIPEMGTITSFSGDPQGDHVFLEYESFDTPTTIYRYDVTSGERSTWFEPRVAATEIDRVVEQHFVISADGTRVPMFTIRRRDVTAPAATLLVGYGGYGISMLPDYSASLMAWVDLGGVAAVANIRGGSEYGAAWHQAARGLGRQNAFDDFIAAGEFLKKEEITSPNGLAIYGDSNGGLLVGAVTNQRPDLVDVALPGVAVMDMVRYPLFTGGAFWIGEFGDPQKEEHFRNLFAYSPYHNVTDNLDYPAILATTSETDVRVVPSHTFKYIAALQAADSGGKPHLARIASATGHGDYMSQDSVIAQLADVWAFAAHWTGLKAGR